jgi:ChrR Cupin-like domain
MSSEAHGHGPDHSHRVVSYVLRTIPRAERSDVEEQISACPECRQEAAALGPIIDTFVAWPTDLLRPPASLRTRLAGRIAAETDGATVSSALPEWVEPEWKEVSPGISVQLLASDTERDRVSMLVRLGPGVDYPPHRHAGVEELHLLDGELIIDDKKLYPGDYIRALPGTADNRVWSETGCTCVLVTSPKDLLR